MCRSTILAQMADDTNVEALRQCYFCGRETDPSEDTVFMMLFDPPNERGMAHTCHRACVEGACAPEVELWPEPLS